MRPPWFLVLTVSCGGIRDYVPRSAPLSPSGIEAWLQQAAAPLEQGLLQADAVPVPPFQFFAVHYRRDIVIETSHPRWSMHEYAEVDVGGQRLWIAKDSTTSGVQIVTADLPKLREWLPEVPIPRRRGLVRVEDRSQGQTLDLTLHYETPLGEPTEVSFAARPRKQLEKKRNSSTFDHSQQAASVLLDVRRRQTKAQASVRYGDREARIRKVLALVPVQALLEQLQAGIAAASMRVSTSSNGRAARVERPFPGTPWPTESIEGWGWSGKDGTGRLSHTGHGVTHELFFEGGGLSRVRLRVDTLSKPALELRLSGSLPDSTRPFEGPVVRHFVAWVGGQPHGHGAITAKWNGDSSEFRMTPEAPYWFARRPVSSRVLPVEEGYRVESRIIDPSSGAPRPVVVDSVPTAAP